MRAKGFVGIVAVSLALAGAQSARAARERVAVRVVPVFAPERYAARGAVGSMVPASGSNVSRETALLSLTHGKLVNSLLGGKPSGKPLIRLDGPPAPVTIYVALPPSGKHHNFARYPIAIVGGGYHGLLLSTSTRIAGLVSIADIAPTVRHLERGRKPILTSRADDDAPADLVELKARLDAAHFARKRSTRALIVLVFGFAALAWGFRRPLFARASLLAVPAMVLASTIASALHVVHSIQWWSGAIALALTVPLALAARTPALFAGTLAALLGAYAVVLGASSSGPTAVIEPHEFARLAERIVKNNSPGLRAFSALLGRGSLNRSRCSRGKPSECCWSIHLASQVN